MLLFRNIWLLGFSHFPVREKKKKVTGAGRMGVVVIKVITTATFSLFLLLGNFL